jgi:hypothetical protein
MMGRIRIISTILFLLLLSACIKQYNPVIDANAGNKYVVSGRVTATEGWQDVNVSLTSPVGSPKYIPVVGCQVNILDDKGNNFAMSELGPGQYAVWMGKENLIPGTSYRVLVLTPGGEQLESGFDKMSQCPPMDSVYYIVKDVPTPDPTITNRIMQFYVDLDAAGDYSRYYKWEIIETWEYHAARPLEYYYDGTIHQVYPPDYSNEVCWITLPVKNVFTVSTLNIGENIYKQYPLHYIDGTTPRLGYLYSMLVRQLSLSEGAYNYWEQMRINSNEQGGLYEKQPLNIKGNMQNLSHPEKNVLGYFYAVSESNKRYFYHDIEGLDLVFSNSCYEDSLIDGFRTYTKDAYPVYFYFRADAIWILNKECIFCKGLGGTQVKPDFWPY